MLESSIVNVFPFSSQMRIARGVFWPRSVTATQPQLFVFAATLHGVLAACAQVDVFKDYFGELEEESIRDNFVIIYELLDETMDFGYPQTMESKILREYITQARL